jgi:hypothetical protein
MTATPYVSLYEQRIALVQDVIVQNSKLGTEKSAELAVLILHAIDHVPEIMR